MNPQKEIAQKELPRSKIYAVQFLKRQYEVFCSYFLRNLDFF